MWSSENSGIGLENLENRRDLESKLQYGKINKLTPLGEILGGERKGINQTLFAEIEGGFRAIAKPSKGESPIRIACPVGTYYLRERAAYLVSKFLQINLVPTTVIREIDGSPASLQEFVPDARTLNSKSEFERLVGADGQVSKQNEKLFALDYLTWNSDRHIFNLLVKGPKIYAIDNGLAFSDDDLYSMLDNEGDRVSSDVRDQLIRACSNNESLRKITKELSRLLPSHEVRAFQNRISCLVSSLRDSQTFPFGVEYNPVVNKKSFSFRSFFTRK